MLNTITSAAFPYGAKQEKAFAQALRQARQGLLHHRQAPVRGDVDRRGGAGHGSAPSGGRGQKLTYLGFSYGSYLGEVYANLFPDRVRALAIDGVIDPVKWAGTKKTQSTPIGARLGSAEGASKALNRALVLCDKAGETKCAFADGNPVANFEKIAQRLRKAPLVEIDEETGDRYVTTYADFVGITLACCTPSTTVPRWSPSSPPYLGELDRCQPRDRSARADGAGADQAGEVCQGSAAAAHPAGHAPRVPLRQRPRRLPDHRLHRLRNSKNLASYATLAKAADKRAPYFGRLWLWNLAGCSSTKWTVKDEDAYRGPFTKKTATPVLIVGNYWDPATNYAGAVSTSKRLPNSRLLSSNSWGHTAYGTSPCATQAVDTYLLTKKVPAKGKVCTGDYTPFQELLDTESTPKSKALKQNSPVAIPPTKPGLR